MPNLLSNQVALVTGAGRGAGRAWALALAARGAVVHVLELNPTLTDDTVSAIQAAGGQAVAHVVDVANKMGVQTALYEVLEQHAQLHWLVNAAHITPPATALKLDEWEWNRTMDVNLKGAFLVAQTTARAMQATGGGTILNVVRPEDQTPHAAVRAARAGLLGLTTALAAEWGPLGVRVRAVETGQDPAQVLVTLVG